MPRFEVFRDGVLHVMKERCASCIFRSVNDGRIRLNPGRTAGMVLDARRRESVIVCHDTLYRDDRRPSVCRGYFDLPHQPAAVQIAERLDLVIYDVFTEGCDSPQQTD